MRFTKEIGIGILVILGTLMSVFSYNYLKGINLFEKTRTFKVIYTKVDGLSPSNPVTLNGYKIGKVQKINFNSNDTKELIVDIVIENDVKFSKTSKAELYETGLIGGKAIAIVPDYDNNAIAQSGDYLIGSIKPGLTDLVNQIMPQIQLQLETVMKKAGIVLSNINTLFDEETKKSLKSSIDQFANLTNNLSETFRNVDAFIKDNSPNLTTTIDNLNATSLKMKDMSNSMSEVDLNLILTNLDSTISNLNNITNKLNQGEGTVGKLIYDDGLFKNLDNATKNLEELIEDIKLNPKRYVHFSIFGKKSDK
ncbi:MAG: MCE family protein [Flavobacteriaceae bacterium]|nr:MCE family protein [Flavobacteriaceae bacterium]MBT4112562.1 MCE family protein [Flavobacteriaceae bacterium]MBT4614416.1 MCE family protein [Flavobacteriaceae bacterium]MBT5246869.1 MCE family protein [Flavobacteriaceae bacterium]MBT5650054.1 MCE family protein [Flavobacteriaceae bacterium]